MNDDAGLADRTPLSRQLQSVAASLLDPQTPAYSLRPEVVELTAILAAVQPTCRAGQADIAAGETRTANGLALSPTMAVMCADDYVRTIQFMRGTQAAIADVRSRFPDRPARVLYVGCGPYATLVVPLMTVLSAAEARYTLLDVHPESIASAKARIEQLGLADTVSGYETVDAGAYAVCPDQPPDIILMEIMQACLQSEPQVAVTRHLLKQAPQTVLIPEEVRIELVMVDMSREFDLTDAGQGAAQLPRDRIPVGTVFMLNRKTVDGWRRIAGSRLPASTVRLPESLEHRHQPMLFTDIRIYRHHVIRGYDSGLTCPRLLSVEGTIKPGDKIRFHYELGCNPGLIGTLLAG